jgi:hypothetical protein
MAASSSGLLLITLLMSIAAAAEKPYMKIGKMVQARKIVASTAAADATCARHYDRPSMPVSLAAQAASVIHLPNALRNMAGFL